jgi:hypothetical protein
MSSRSALGFGDLCLPQFRDLEHPFFCLRVDHLVRKRPSPNRARLWIFCTRPVRALPEAS